ncbi:MAG: hypothetical protein KatS3mg077_1813 [Candidatus Binatia bacterium]|nr:MAG: hypothetical protein KatS3mg077_1813 [Candidatus Binatia bacterium]
MQPALRGNRGFRSPTDACTGMCGLNSCRRLLPFQISALGAADVIGGSVVVLPKERV